MMKIGLAVSRTTVRAILVRSGKAVWAKTVAYGGPDELANTVREILSSAPLPRMHRRSACLAVAPSLSQVKRIHGLPAITDTSVLARLVATSIARFFMKTPQPVLVTGVRVAEPGLVWAGVIDEPTILAVAEGCRAARFRLDRVVPAAAVIGLAVEGDGFCWTGDKLHLHLLYSKAELVSVRRGGSADSTCIIARPVPGLSTVADAIDYASAFGSALIPKSFPISLDARWISRRGTLSRWRIGLAAFAVIAALIIALLAPLYTVIRAGQKAEHVVAALADEMRLANEIDSNLSNVTNALNRVATFAAGRRSGILLLEQLTTALPERTAIVALRADTVGGTLVVVGPNAANVPSALDKIPLLTGAQITGPITTEMVAGEPVERVTIRFRFADRRTIVPSPGAARAD